jgi:DUF971 family protein
MTQLLPPVKIKAPHGSRALELWWTESERRLYPHESLRGYCPCAGCQGHSGSIRFIEGGNQELTGIEQVGNYALSLTWGDGHSSGIYTFSYLKALGALLESEGADGLKALKQLPRV